MKGTVLIEMQNGGGKSPVLKQTLAGVFLSLQSSTHEAVISKMVDGDSQELLVLEHAVVDIFASEDNQDAVEVRGFRRVSASPLRYVPCRLVFSPA